MISSRFFHDLNLYTRLVPVKYPPPPRLRPSKSGFARQTAPFVASFLLAGGSFGADRDEPSARRIDLAKRGENKRNETSRHSRDRIIMATLNHRALIEDSSSSLGHSFPAGCNHARLRAEVGPVGIADQNATGDGQ